MLHYCPSLFRCLFIVQWNFCLGILPVCIVLKLIYTPKLHFHTLFPHPMLFNSFHGFCFILFLHRYDVFHYCSLSVLPSFLPPLVSSTSPTFGYVFCVYFYVFIILFVFDLGLYSTYDREYAAFGFLNLANFT
jgi:hypothetical protein